MEILEQLGSGEGMPIEAIRAATAARSAVAPLLLDAIERCEPNGEVEENGLFIAFHLLGQWREKSAYRPLARFLRRPDVEAILGDATTETSHRIMAGVFDGDPGPICDIINDPEADEFVRGRMFDALVILVFRGELDRTEVAGFLKSGFTDLQPQGPCAVWHGWQGAVALLALTELEPLVRKAFQRGFIEEIALKFNEFEDDLKRACAGRPLRPWQRREYEPFGDTVEELSGWAGFRPKEQRDDKLSDPWPQMPVHNPFRNVGRNDPCPCGSGKKFKKCCLGKPSAERQASANDRFFLDDADDVDDVDGPIRDYDPHIEPDPSDWLATAEQQRLDLVEQYHRRQGLNAEHNAAHAAIHVIIENQIATGDQLPVHRTMVRLIAEGLDRHEAIHAIASILAGHLNERLRETGAKAQRKSDRDVNASYFRELERLTAEGWLGSG